MNRLLSFLLIISLFSSELSFSQQGYLFVKRGLKKKCTYTEGDVINVKLNDGATLKGYISLLRNDTLFINGQPVHKTAVSEVLLTRRPKKPFPDIKTVALIAAGSALTSFGLAMSDKDHREEAIIAGPVIGFGPLLLSHFGGRAIRGLTRKKFRIGKRFYLQVLDFHLNPQRLRTF